MKSRIITFLIALFYLSEFCYSSPMAKIVRKLGGVADKVPIRKMDNLIRKGPDVGTDVIKNSKLLKALDETLGGVVDPATLKTIKAMDEPSQEIILQVARGSKSVKENIPDIMLRSNFIKEASGETLEALGRGDKLLVKDAVTFKNAIDAKVLKAPTGMRSLTFDDFGAFFKKTGERGMKFWKNNVRPHWKLWLAGTALTAVILTPEEYLDEFGNLTKEGVRKVIAFGGKELAAVLGGATEGVSEGTKEITKKVVVGFFKGFFSDFWGVLTIILIIVGTLVGLWFFPPTRSFMKRICGKFKKQKQPESKS